MVYLHSCILHSSKKKGHLEICSQMMDQENIIFSEVTQTHKTNILLLYHKWLLDIKQRKTSLQFTIPENLDNNENPKRDIHESNLHGK